MSNTAVGQVYNRVIDAVVEASRIDFEEDGVSSTILDSLREKWQERLSQTNRALFPWDPQPSQNNKAESPSRQESNIPEPNSSSATQAPPSGSNSAPTTQTQTNGTSDVQVKQEQALENSFLNLPQQNYTSGLGSQYAAQRAAQLVRQQFGSQASGSIGALQAAGGTLSANQGQQLRGVFDPSTGVKAESPASAPVKQENSDSDLTKSQTDGACDSSAKEWQAVIARRNARGEDEPLGTIEIDRVIRSQVEEMARRLDGGLMVPLDERYPNRRQPKHRVRRPIPVDATGSSSGNVTVGVGNVEGDMVAYNARFDGAPDSDEDEDAINSDLDDPEETAENSIEAMYEGDVILCLYDKVQRVKNKWKCVLKDGVVTVDGRDYVFHKASGEFEW